MKAHLQTAVGSAWIRLNKPKEVCLFKLEHLWTKSELTEPIVLDFQQLII